MKRWHEVGRLRQLARWWFWKPIVVACGLTHAAIIRLTAKEIPTFPIRCAYVKGDTKHVVSVEQPMFDTFGEMAWSAYTIWQSWGDYRMGRYRTTQELIDEIKEKMKWGDRPTE